MMFNFDSQGLTTEFTDTLFVVSRPYNQEEEDFNSYESGIKMLYRKDEEDHMGFRPLQIKVFRDADGQAVGAQVLGHLMAWNHPQPLPQSHFFILGERHYPFLDTVSDLLVTEEDFEVWLEAARQHHEGSEEE